MSDMAQGSRARSFEPAWVDPRSGAVIAPVTAPPVDPRSGGITAPVTAPRRLLSTLDSNERKKYPITTGFIDYFPDATAMVAHVSWLGNNKHNPGQPLHWARGKSADHEDCIARHTIERDVFEGDVLHAAMRAWRAMAALQELCEVKYNLDLPRGAKAPDGTV